MAILMDNSKEVVVVDHSLLSNSFPIFTSIMFYLSLVVHLKLTLDTPE